MEMKIHEYISNSVLNGRVNLQGMFVIFYVLLMVDGVRNEITGFEHLKEAILSNNVLRLKKIFSKEITLVHSRSEIGQTALHVAARVGDLLMLKMILEVSKDPNPVDVVQRTPLHLAAAKGHKKAVAVLLENGAKIEASDKWKRTALHEAAEKDRRGVVQYLLSKGANIHARDRIGNTPLHLASCSSSSGVVKVLLSNGSDTTLRNKKCRIPLAMAALCGRLTLFKILNARPKPKNYKDSKGNTIEHLVVMGKSRRLLRFLIKKRQYKELKNNLERTPLHIASEFGGYQLVKLLVLNGADLNAQDSNGDSPLHLAVKSEDYRTVSFLLDHASNYRLKNKKGMSPIDIIKQNDKFHPLISDAPWVSSSSSSPDVTSSPGLEQLDLFKEGIVSDDIAAIEELLITGYHMDDNISSCQTPLRYAVENCRLSIMELLIEKGADVNEYYDCEQTLVHFVVSEGQPPSEEGNCPKFTTNKNCAHDILGVLLRHGADVNAVNCNGSTPLHLAAEFNNLKATELLINAGASIDKKDEQCRKPIFISVLYNNNEILIFLLSKNASVNERECSPSNVYPIHIAARNGNIKIIDILLQAGAQIESKSSWYERRPIHEASIHNKSEAVKFLVGKGAEVNAEDLWMRTSLHLVAERGFVEVAEVLLDSKADLEAEMREHRTPLIIAAEHGQLDLARLLLKKGANFRAKSDDGRTGLHWASGGGDAVLVLEFLKVYPEAVNLPDYPGKTPLFWASFCGCIDIFTLLIKWKANPLIKTHLNMTILHGVAESGNYETAKEALRFDIDINALDKNGRTALFIAATGGHKEVFSLFLKNGADPDIRSKQNETLLHWAVTSDNEFIMNEVIKMTKNIDAQDSGGMTPMYHAAIQGRYNAFQKLFEHGANPTISMNNGDTLLHWCAYVGDKLIMEKVLKRTVDIEYQDRRGRTALYIAAERGKTDVFILLMNKNANLNITTNNGRTLIHGATIGRNLTIVKIVLNSVKNINAQDDSGRTALNIAASMASTIIFNCLLEYGADMTIKNFDGRTILHAAAHGGDYQITEVVLKRSDILNDRDEHGKSAIFYAAENRKKQVFNLLLKLGADTKAAKGGWTLLHSIAKGGNGDIFAMVQNSTEDINARNDEGETALFVSVSNYNKKMFELMLHSLADPDIPNKIGYTSLHWASHYGDYDFASKILDVSQSSVNSRDIGGKTPLHWAVYYGHLKLVEILLQFNADTGIENIYGYTPVMIAAAKGTVKMMELFSGAPYNGEAMLGISLAWGNREVMNYFLENKVKPTEKNKLHFSAARGDNVELERLFRSNANSKRQRFHDITKEIAKEYMRFTASMDDDDVHIINPLQFKLSPLHMAILFNGSVETVRLIINMTNASTIDLIKHRGRWTPLDMAAFCGKNDMVNYFLNFGIPVTLAGGDSWTCTHKAAWGGHKTTIKLLFENGADINVPDILGRTPLHIAAMRGYNVTVAQILQLSNDSINARDRYMFTPLHLAEIYGHQKYFESLALGTITRDASLRYALKDPGLVTSSLRNHTRTVEVLLAHGADPNAQDRVFGWTVLHWSAAIGHIEVARVLVEHGARINLPSKIDQTPMYLARFWWRIDLYYFLKERDGVW